jgi:hypothetical protein
LGRAVLRKTILSPRGGTSLVTAIWRSERAAALRVWSAFALLLTLASAPLFSTVVPPLFDYPNHLARMHLLTEGGNIFYAVHWAPLPNLAQDLIVPLVSRLMSLELASKLFLAMIFGMISAGAVWLNRIATSGWRMWPLLAFLLLYNRSFLWGFVNYLFGVGVALCGIALWLTLERKSALARVFASSVVALGCYFSHIVAFGFYLLVILGLEGAPSAVELRLGDWRALARRIAIVGPQFLMPALLLIICGQGTARGPISFPSLLRKADLLFSVFDNYDRVFDISCFALFIAFITWLAITGRIRVSRRFAWAAGMVFTVYLLLPSQIFGGSAADHRLPPALFLLLIAASAPRFPNNRIAVTAGILAAATLTIRVAMIEVIWLKSDQVYSADLGGIDMLPLGAKLAMAYPSNAINFISIPELHFAALAVARREAFVPTLFAQPTQQPVVPRPSYRALAKETQPERLWSAFVENNASDLVSLPTTFWRYDFVAFTDNRPVKVLPNSCLKAVFLRPTFQIFAVVQRPSCRQVEGYLDHDGRHSGSQDRMCCHRCLTASAG